MLDLKCLIENFNRMCRVYVIVLARKVAGTCKTKNKTVFHAKHQEIDLHCANLSHWCNVQFI